MVKPSGRDDEDLARLLLEFHHLELLELRVLGVGILVEEIMRRVVPVVLTSG